MITFKSLMEKEGPILGLYLSSSNLDALEAIKAAGFDFVRIDYEHILFDESEMRNIIQTATLLDMPVQARISSLDDILKLLDYGVTGIVVSDVNTVERAKEAVEKTKFYPIGLRGMFPPGRGVKMTGLSFKEYLKEANDIVNLIVQIEDVKAASCIDEIASLPGIDMLASGKNDISQSAGIPGETDDPIVLDFEELIISKALEYGKQPAILVSDRKRIDELMARGAKFFTCGPDDIIIANAFKAYVDNLRG